jgi:nucleotide-binding universal stress UspA family protein
LAVEQIRQCEILGAPGRLVGRGPELTVANQNRRSLPITAWGFTEYEGSPDGGRFGFKRIVLAVSHSGSSNNAVAVVAAMARVQASEVFVIHLSERLFLGRCYWDLESTDEAQQLINDTRADLARRGVRAETWTDKSLANMTSRRIVDTAAELKADLIVIGRPQGKSSFWAELRGSVSHEVLHRSSVPVLVVP